MSSPRPPGRASTRAAPSAVVGLIPAAAPRDRAFKMVFKTFHAVTIQAEIKYHSNYNDFFLLSNISVLKKTFQVSPEKVKQLSDHIKLQFTIIKYILSHVPTLVSVVV